MSGNIEFYAMFRTGTRVYTSRPPANCRSARQAWDYLSEPSKAPIKDMHLVDGYWICERTDGTHEDVENTFEADKKAAE